MQFDGCIILSVVRFGFVTLKLFLFLSLYYSFIGNKHDVLKSEIIEEKSPFKGRFDLEFYSLSSVKFTFILIN